MQRLHPSRMYLRITHITDSIASVSRTPRAPAGLPKHPNYEGDRVHCLDVAHAMIRRAMGTPEDTHRFRRALAPLNAHLGRLFVSRGIFQVMGGTYGRRLAERAILRLQRRWRIRHKRNFSASNAAAASPEAPFMNHSPRSRRRSPPIIDGSVIEIHMSPAHVNPVYQNVHSLPPTPMQTVHMHSPASADHSPQLSRRPITITPTNMNDPIPSSLPSPNFVRVIVETEDFV